MTVVCIKLPKITAPSDSIFTVMLQEHCAEIINTITKHDGMLISIANDDKGVSCLFSATRTKERERERIGREIEIGTGRIQFYHKKS